MTIEPGRAFWSGLTAFCANMVALFGVDKFRVTEADIMVNDWWIAILLSLFVGGAVYGREKLAEIGGRKSGR